MLNYNLEALSEQHHRLGVLGGTFNPIHLGHIAMAQAATQTLGLNHVLFIPTGRPPHKPRQIFSAEHRYAMTLLATAPYAHFDVSRMEIDRGGVSYTADTLEELRKLYVQKVYFIIGADAMQDILSWKSPELVLSRCILCVCARKGVDESTLDNLVRLARSKYNSKIAVIEMDADISSTRVRDCIELDMPIDHLLPAEVSNYIRKHGLYKSDGYDLKGAQKIIGASLSDKRWRHTLGVVGEAVKLAERYGANRRKAYAAALFHDCAKEIEPERKRALCKAWNLQIDSVMDEQIGLTHGLLSAEIARREFAVDDPEILNAICCHTTGAEQMSLLDKILLIADLTELSRKGVDPHHREDLRAAAMDNLDKAIVMALKIKIEFTLQQKRTVHPVSLKALEYAENKFITKGDTKDGV
ncbi:MAG: nicotinate-nucleotide adenylyltransferase [Clostridiales bacterium]|nr:nicotinate-nucleotide adenylyltransferase [Clostridiales bacterium]